MCKDWHQTPRQAVYYSCWIVAERVFTDRLLFCLAAVLNGYSLIRCSSRGTAAGRYWRKAVCGWSRVWGYICVSIICFLLFPLHVMSCMLVFGLVLVISIVIQHSWLFLLLVPARSSSHRDYSMIEFVNLSLPWLIECCIDQGLCSLTRSLTALLRERAGFGIFLFLNVPLVTSMFVEVRRIEFWSPVFCSYLRSYLAHGMIWNIGQ